MARSFKERFPKRNRAAFQILARNVKRLRGDRGLKQDELAAILGSPPSLISQVENCRANLTLETLDDLATALGVRAGELFAAPATAAGTEAGAAQPRRACRRRKTRTRAREIGRIP